MASTKTLMISMAIATHAIQVAGKHNDIGLPCDLHTHTHTHTTV